MTKYKLPLVAIVFAVVCAAVPGPSVAQTPAKCAAKKMTQAGKKAFKKLKCHAKATKKGEAVDTACLDKVEQTFNDKFAIIEGAGGCVTTGDAGSIEAEVDAFVDAIVAALPANTPTPAPTSTPTGTPTPIPNNGDNCTSNTDCDSGICAPRADGFTIGGTTSPGICCNKPCTGTCQSCEAAYTGKADGVCNLVNSGIDPLGSCLLFDCCSPTGTCMLAGCSAPNL